MKKKLQLKKETRTDYRGVGECARRLGYSREHLSRVLHGKAKGGKRLLSSIAKIGVKVQA